MTDAVRRSDCLNAETIAALIDNTLAPDERSQAEAHLAACANCYGVFVDASDTVAAAGALVVPKDRRAGWKRWTPLIGVAAGLALAIVWLRPFGLAFTPDQKAEAALDRLANVTTAERWTPGGMSAPFRWAPKPKAVRSASAPTPTPLELDEEINALRRLCTDHPNSRTLRALGAAYLVAGKVDEAITSLSRAVDIDPADANAHTDLAAAYLERLRRPVHGERDARSALDHAVIALQVRTSIPALVNRAKALQAMGPGFRAEAIAAWEAVRAQGDPDWTSEAVAEIAQLRQSSARDPPLDDLEARAEDELVALARTRPIVLTRAVDQMLETWSQAESGPHPSPLPQLAVRLGGALRSAHRDALRTDLVHAIIATDPAQSSRRSRLSELIRSFHTSVTAYDGSEYAVSAALARQARATAESLGLPSEALEAQALWAESAMPSTRAAALQRSLELAPRLRARSYSRSIGRIEQAHGLDAMGRAAISDGLDAYARAASAADQSGDPDLIATVASSTAEAFRNAGEYDRAWQAIRPAFDLIPDLTPRRRHMVFAAAALTALREGDAGVAWEFAGFLKENAPGFGNGAGQLTASIHAARALQLLGRPSEALRTARAAEALVTTLPSPTDRARYATDLALLIGDLLSQSDPAQAIASLTIAIDSLEKGDTSIRMPAALLSRARAHEALGRRTETLADLVRGLKIFEDQRPGMRAEQLRLSRLSANWNLFGDLIKLLDEDVPSLEIAERSRARALLDSLNRSRSPAEPLKGAALSEWIRDDTAVLVYATLDDRLIVWKVTRGHVDRVQWPVALSSLTALVESFVDDTRRGQPSRAGQKLAAYLLPSDLSAARTVVVGVIPDGPLHRVPFSALPVPGTGRPLVADFVPVVAPSLTMAARVAPRRASGHELLIGYGEARASANLPELPGVSAEIHNLVRLYPRSQRLVGMDATAPAVLAALPRATLIHFAGHAVGDEVYPAESRLFVAPDGGIDAIGPADIAALELRPDALVVLGACETARGRVVQGEGAMTLARPFLAAGAAGVVATLWPVGDDSAADLLTALHTGLAHGASPAEALVEAQRQALRANGKATTWASFQLIGSIARAP